MYQFSPVGLNNMILYIATILCIATWYSYIDILNNVIVTVMKSSISYKTNNLFAEFDQRQLELIKGNERSNLSLLYCTGEYHFRLDNLLILFNSVIFKNIYVHAKKSGNWYFWLMIKSWYNVWKIFECTGKLKIVKNMCFRKGT